MFGLPRGKAVVNVIILIAKQFIVTRRFNEERVRWNEFVQYLSRYCQMEKIIAIKNKNIDRFISKWAPLLSRDLQINI